MRAPRERASRENTRIAAAVVNSSTDRLLGAAGLAGLHRRGSGIALRIGGEGAVADVPDEAARRRGDHLADVRVAADETRGGTPPPADEGVETHHLPVPETGPSQVDTLGPPRPRHRAGRRTPRPLPHP